MKQATRELLDAHSSYTPSDFYKESFVGSGFTAFTGSVAGAGKDFFKDAAAERCDGTPCPSLTDREPRDSDKGDYVHVTVEELRDSMDRQELIEYEPIERDGEFYFYSTSGLYIKRLADEGLRPFKDIEPNGVSSLKKIVGDKGVVKAVHPLPDLTVLEDGRTQWEHLLTDRDFEGKEFVDILKGDCGEKAAKDLKGRLGKARDAGEIIVRAGLLEDRDTLFVINTVDRTEEALELTSEFIRRGIGRAHASSGICPTREMSLWILDQVASIANRALVSL